MDYWNVFQSLLSQIDHEDSLLVARTQWLILSQFLLFVGYLCVDRSKLPANPPVNYHRLISVLGIVSTIFILSSILAAIKLFVELRTSMFMLLAQHPDLPMRKLDRYGVGTGLMTPVLLSLALVFTWSFVTFPNRLAAVFMTASAFLLSFYVIVLGHELADGPVKTWLLVPSLSAGIVLLVAAIWLGARSVKKARPAG